MAIFNRSASDHPMVAATGSKSGEITLISQHCQIKGELTLNGDIHIDGVVEGKINGSGTILVSSNGRVLGEVTAQHIGVNGIIDGRCHANTIEILSHGRIEGVICTEDLSMEKGSVFLGQSERLAVAKSTMFSDDDSLLSLSSQHDDET